jgi:hypothetical protein
MILAVFIAQPQWFFFGLLMVYLHYRYVDKKPLTKAWNWFETPMKTGAKKEEEKTNAEYGFSTYADMREKATKGWFKEGFEKDPEWQKNSAELKEIMRKNRARNEAELRKEDELRDNDL